MGDINWDDINPINKKSTFTGSAFSGEFCMCGKETFDMRLSQKLKNFVYTCSISCEKKLNKI